MEYINERTKFWDHSYTIWLNRYAKPLSVNANNLQEAFDYAADYAEEQGWSGLWITDENDLKFHDEHDEISFLGNHSLPFISHELHAEQLD